MSEIIEEERGLFSYQAFVIGDAIYDVEEKINDGYYDEAIRYLMKGFLNALKDDKDGFHKTYEPFAFSSFFVKHQGFREENEARIVACPLTESVLQAFKLENPGFDPGYPLKEIHEREHPRTGKPVPFIKLFNRENIFRAIKGVIVGPGEDQQRRMEHAVDLTEGRVNVRCSITPFIG
jgi:hypothetical protein